MIRPIYHYNSSPVMPLGYLPVKHLRENTQWLKDILHGVKIKSKHLTRFSGILRKSHLLRGDRMASELTIVSFSTKFPAKVTHFRKIQQISLVFTRNIKKKVVFEKKRAHSVGIFPNTSKNILRPPLVLARHTTLE